MAIKGYNGHKSWAFWNVALWIGNDEFLYNSARFHIRHNRTKDAAAKAFVAQLQEYYGGKTPDGANYSYSAVRAAISGM